MFFSQFCALHHPVHGFDQGIHVHGFEDGAVHARVQEPLPVFAHGESGHGDDRNPGFAAEGLIRPDAPGRLYSFS